MEQGWNFVSGLGLTLKKENIKTMDHILLALIFKISDVTGFELTHCNLRLVIHIKKSTILVSIWQIKVVKFEILFLHVHISLLLSFYFRFCPLLILPIRILVLHVLILSSHFINKCTKIPIFPRNFRTGQWRNCLGLLSDWICRCSY